MEMLKKEYESPTLEIVWFDEEDIITESPSHSDGVDIDAGAGWED